MKTTQRKLSDYITASLTSSEMPTEPEPPTMTLTRQPTRRQSHHLSYPKHVAGHSESSPSEAPLICTDAVPEAIEAASRATARLIEQVEKINSHAALFFLSRYASVPRCIYLMCSAPTFQITQQLRAIDEGMCAAITCFCNVTPSNDNWI